MKRILYFSFFALFSIYISTHINFDQREPVSGNDVATVISKESKTSIVSKSNVQSPEKKTSIKDDVLIDRNQNVKSYYDASIQFNSFTSYEKLETRKVALSNLISGEDLSMLERVSLQQDWEREGTAEPGFQHKRSTTKVDVNGVEVDFEVPGKIVADSLMVHVSKSELSLLNELSTIPGINSIEPVFSGKNRVISPGRRDLAGWQKINVSAAPDRIKSIVRALKAFEGVTEAEPVYERRLSTVTTPFVNDLDDPRIPDQWHLDTAKIKDAWNYLESNNLPAGGDPSILVAVIDSGVDYDHPDLTANMWRNMQEVPGNGVDDDENGYVDDFHGASVIGSSFSHSGDPADDNGHGTHVAGIIAASGANTEGGVGVAFNARIMAIKAAQYTGVLTTTDIAEAIYYAVDNGADVINMSYGGYGRSVVEEDALALAFSQAVLVAAAGNDGRPNQSACSGSPIFPASYPWVVGVMSRVETMPPGFGLKSPFSNWDCITENGIEYELMAPGSAIWSTLPDGGYASWSGTSMAAPVVSGIAALARTNWPDKSSYSSRFIMGQIAITGEKLPGYKPPADYMRYYHNANALEALTKTPKPELGFEDYYIFDDVDEYTVNDDDGRVDAGEKIELAIVIRNRWGRADNVTATLSTSENDPYVTFQTSTVNYGAVGSFNKDDNGLVYNEDLLVTGVNNPFVFSVDPSTPNNIVIRFTLTMSAENGLDSEDQTTYTTSDTFELIVQRGRELPSIIDSDAPGTAGGAIDTDGLVNGVVTLDNTALYIVDKPVLVDENVIVNVTEGAQMQFWSSLSDETYAVWRPSFIQVDGELNFNGTADQPISLFPSTLYPHRSVNIYKLCPNNSDEGVVMTKKIRMSYTNVTNIMANGSPKCSSTVSWEKLDYNRFTRQGDTTNVNWVKGLATDTDPDRLSSIYNLEFPIVTSSGLPYARDGFGIGNVFRKASYYAPGLRKGDAPFYFSPNKSPQNGSLFDSNNFQYEATMVNSTFLLNHYEYLNNFGDYVQPGSKVRPNLYFHRNTAAYKLIESFVYGGKTYVHYLSNYRERGSSWETNIAAARALAQLANGTLYTPSNDDEFVAIYNWKSSLTQRSNEEWTEKYEFCQKYPYCDRLSTSFNIGLIKLDNGTWIWDDSDDQYANDLLKTQYNWDPVAWKEANGEEPSSSEVNYQKLARIGTIRHPGSSITAPEDDEFWLRQLDNYAGEDAPILLELPGELSEGDLDALEQSYSPPATFTNNAFLNDWNILEPNSWLTFHSSDSESLDSAWDNLAENYEKNFWGGAGSSLIDIAINDFSDNFNKRPITYLPVLSSAPELAYPFVSNLLVLDEEGNAVAGNKFGAQSSSWRISFNRDMDTTKQPLVTFGPEVPYTDFAVPGEWIDSRTWQGSYTFSTLSGDGVQKILVAGAVAADNSRLVTGVDVGRYRFELITSGTEALTLQASGGTGQVSLTWIQDDFELLHGYNLYRSMEENGNYTRINSSTINKTINEYVDTDVTPGVQHFYYFKVVTDGGESNPSNIAVAAPLDTVDPVITHKTETVISLNDSLTLRATVTDNILVRSVNIFFRNAQSSAWQSRQMLETDADRYSVTLSGSDIGNQYLEYYIEAKDAVNTVQSGSVETPYKVFVSLPSDTDTDGDGVSNAEDAFPYDPTETTDLDGDGIGDNADLDDDGDGYNDDVDAFPRDSSEWVDTDGDGIGNNADSDDDNDGTPDGSDRFPLDARGSLDSDNDGMPDQWEIENGLNPNDSSDADSDHDFDGYTALEEFEADTSPIISDRKTQIVYHESSPFVAGFSNNVRVLYRSSDAESGLNGLGMRVHYNSALIDSIVINDILLLDLIAVDSQSMPDSADYDNDPLTDSYLNIAWATTSGGSSWPGGMPVKLFDLKVTFSESITADSKVHIRFSSSSTHPGYAFSSVPIKTTVNINSLDIDGNGDPDALSDGLLILRSLFGLTEEALIQNAVSPNAPYSSSAEIQSRINALGDFIDIDGNDSIDPLSDGLLILRYMFGIRGATLINGVVASDATRQTASEIEAYLAKMIPNL